MPIEPQTFALYRFYGSGGTLLYIGVTGSLPRRLGQHNEDKNWWAGVARVEVEHYPSRTAVLEAEKRAIVAEKPLYNGTHNDAGSRWKAAAPAKPTPAPPRRPTPEEIRRIETRSWRLGKVVGLSDAAVEVLKLADPAEADGLRAMAREALGDDDVALQDDDADLLVEMARQLAYRLDGRLNGLRNACRRLLQALPPDLLAQIVGDADLQVRENDPDADEHMYECWRVFSLAYYLEENVFHTAPPPGADPWPGLSEGEVPF